MEKTGACGCPGEADSNRVKTLLILVACLLAGCAAVERNEIHQQSLWLQKAGFRTVKFAALSAVSPSQTTMARREIVQRNGEVIYVFTDSARGLSYVGGPRQLAAYQEISTAAKARRSANLAQITPSRSRTTGPLVW